MAGRYRMILYVVISVLAVTVAALFLHYFSSVPFHDGLHRASDCREENLPQPQRLDGMCDNVCITRDCVLTAGRMLDSMDTSVDPCEDFYQYACGSFHRTRYPDDEMRYAGMSEYQEDMLLSLVNAIQDVTQKPSKTVSISTFRKMQRFYAHCLNATRADTFSLDTVVKILSNLGLNGWPHLPKNWAFNRSIDEIFSGFALSNSYSVVSIYRDESVLRGELLREDVVQIALVVQNPYLPPDVYRKAERSDNDKLGRYERAIEYVLYLFGVDGDEAERYVKEVLQFETKLSLLHEVLEDQPQARDEDIEVSGCRLVKDGSEPNFCWSKASRSPWFGFLQHYFARAGVPTELGDAELFLPNGNKEGEAALKLFIDTVPDRVLANYLALRFVLAFSKDIDYFFGQMVDIAESPEKGEEQLSTERWHYCLDWTKRVFHLLLEEAFTHLHLEGGRGAAELDWLNLFLVNSTISAVKKMSWLSDEAKQGIRAAISSFPLFTEHIASLHLRPYTLDELYEDLNFEGESFVEDVVENHRYKSIKDAKKLFGTDDTPRFEPRMLETAAFVPLFTEKKALFVTLGMLKLPLFGLNRPSVANIAGIGNIVTHELGHVHDFSTRKYATSDKEQRKFAEIKNCIISQYSKYAFTFINDSMPSEKNIGDDYADCIAQHFTFEAFDRYLQMHPYTPSLPLAMGNSISLERAHFLLAAQPFCDILTPAGEKDMLEDDHSPGKYRIIGSISNMEEFANAYGCPAGSPMNPVQKCSFL